MFVHYPLFTQNHPPFLYYKKGHILRLLVNCGLSLLPFQVIYCETQILTDQKLTSSTFPCCVFVCPSKSVTSPLFSTLWCFRPYKPYISRKLMTPTIHWLTDQTTHPSPMQTHQAHHIAIWVSHSLLCLVYLFISYTFYHYSFAAPKYVSLFALLLLSPALQCCCLWHKAWVKVLIALCVKP